MQPVHIEHPHLGEMMPLREIRPNSKTTEKKMTTEVPHEGFDTISGNSENKHCRTTRATPDSVAEAQSELSDLDFTKFYCERLKSQYRVSKELKADWQTWQSCKQLHCL